MANLLQDKEDVNSSTCYIPQIVPSLAMILLSIGTPTILLLRKQRALNVPLRDIKITLNY